MDTDEIKIEILLKDIILILKKNKDFRWIETLNSLLNEYSLGLNRDETVRKILQIYKGGMGSFTDLILQKNWDIIVEENDKLYKMKEELYSACKNYLVAHR